MINDDKYRTDILDSRMDSTGSGGRGTKEPVDPQATPRRYPPLNVLVTPGRVCDTYSDELKSSLTSRPKCSPTEASAEVVTTGAQCGAVPHTSTSFGQSFEQVINHESSARLDGISVSRTIQTLRDSRSDDRVGLRSTPYDDDAVVSGGGVGSSTGRSDGVLSGDGRWSTVNEEDGGTRTSAVDGQVQSSSAVPEWPSRVDVRSCVPVTSLPLTEKEIRESIRDLQNEVARREIELIGSVDLPNSRDQLSQVTESNKKSKHGKLTGKSTGTVGVSKCVAGNAELPVTTPVSRRDVIRDVEPDDEIIWESGL